LGFFALFADGMGRSSLGSRGLYRPPAGPIEAHS